MNRKKLIEKAQRKAKVLQNHRKDPRYLKTIGKLKREGFIDVRDVPEYRGQVFLQDALWAAEIEPRVYELLPAILARRPKFFTFQVLPEDLDRVVREIKAGHPKTPYLEITPEKYGRWTSFVGRGSKPTKVMTAFRLGQEDLELLRRLSEEMSKSKAEILSQALKEFAKR